MKRYFKMLVHIHNWTISLKSILHFTWLILALISRGRDAEGLQNPNEKIFPLVSTDPDEVRFYLSLLRQSVPNYTEEIQFNEIESLRASSFMRNKVTVFYIHGFFYTKGHGYHPIINAYLTSGIEGNFIFVDWSKLSNPEIDKSKPFYEVDIALGYVEVVKNVPIVGNRIAEFIAWLYHEGVLSLGQVHLISHSLGAHVGGAAGSRLQVFAEGKRLRRITGLDPAGPLLEVPVKLKHALRKGDADFVDVLHTNFGIFGNIEKNGDVDIFVNNGVVQTGCETWNITQVINCSHSFPERIYVSSFKKPLIACECPVWRLLLGRCNTPCSQPITVGPYTKETAKGIYHLETGKDP